MGTSLADFSKGAVRPKYLIVEMVRDPRWMTICLTISWGIWFIGWLWVAIEFDSYWFFLLIALPLLAAQWIYRVIYSWREKGTITLTDTAFQINLNNRTSEVEYKMLRRIGTWTLVGKPLQRFGTSSPKDAIVVAFLLMIDGAKQELHIVNEMHLSLEDKLQFMSPPPNFGTLIFRLCELNKIRASNGKDENWSDRF